MNYIPKFSYIHPIDGATDIVLTLPQEGDPLKEVYATSGAETRSNSGRSQYQRNYIDQSFSFKLVFLDKNQVDALFKMFTDYASLGYSFQYFPSSDELESHNVIWSGSKKTFAPIRVIASGSDFIYDLSFSIRVEI